MDPLPVVRTLAYIAMAAIAVASYLEFGISFKGLGLSFLSIGLMLLVAGFFRAADKVEANGCRECGFAHGQAHGFCTLCGYQAA